MSIRFAISTGRYSPQEVQQLADTCRCGIEVRLRSPSNPGSLEQYHSLRNVLVVRAPRFEGVTTPKEFGERLKPALNVGHHYGNIVRCAQYDDSRDFDGPFVVTQLGFLKMDSRAAVDDCLRQLQDSEQPNKGIRCKMVLELLPLIEPNDRQHRPHPSLHVWEQDIRSRYNLLAGINMEFLARHGMGALRNVRRLRDRVVYLRFKVLIDELLTTGSARFVGDDQVDFGSFVRAANQFSGGNLIVALNLKGRCQLEDPAVATVVCRSMDRIRDYIKRLAPAG